MNAPNFEEFRYTGSEDHTVIHSTIASRQLTYSRSGYSSDTTEQQLATFLTTPSHIDGDEVLVRMTEFSDDNGRPSGAIFDALIAESTGRRVIDANMPGVDFYSEESKQAAQELTPDQIEDLKKRSFSKTGDAALCAVHNAAIEFDISQKYILIGSCMGGSLAAGGFTAARERGMDIAGMTFSDVVNIASRPNLQLVAQFAATRKYALSYDAMNPKILRDVAESTEQGVQRMMTDRKANALYWGANTNAGFIADLGSSDYLEDLPIYMTRGAGSKLSPATAFETTVRHLTTKADVQTKVFGDPQNNPHDHGYSLTVQSYIDAVNNIIDRSH
jgi:hypothetical protein